LHFYA